MAETQQTHHRLATPHKTLQSVVQESPKGVVLPAGAQPPERDDQCHLYQDLASWHWVAEGIAPEMPQGETLLRLRLAQILAQHVVLGGRGGGLGPEVAPSGHWSEREPRDLRFTEIARTGPA